MKKLCFIVLALIMSLTLCCGLTACSGGDKIVEQLQSEIGAILEGGKFKEGSVLNVNEVKVTSEQADDIFEKLEDIGITVSDKTKAYIYDIFVTKDGKEVQPNGKVKVTVPMPQEDTGYLVYHIEDGNKAVKIPSTYADGKISFETDGFSCYVFVATGYVNDSSILKIQYQLTVDVQPANGGYIEINGEKQNASEGIWLPAGYNRLQAFENEGYVFDCWWDADFDEMLMEDDVCDFYMNNKRHLIAKFKEAPYTLELNVNGYGVIEFNGTTVSSQTWESVERNASVTLTATAYGSYEFAGWYTPSGLLSESETYTFTMDGNKSIEAKFNDTGRVAVLFSATPEGSGYFVYNNVKSDEIAEKWEIGTEYTVRAVPNPGYKFLYWEIENEQIWSEVYSGTVPSTGLDGRAVFGEADYYLEVNAVGGKIQEKEIDGIPVNDSEFVTEYKKGFYHVNNVTFDVQGDEGYRFVGWYNEEGLLSDLAWFSVDFSGNKQIKLEARFEKITYRFSASASEGGYITENGEAVDFGNGRIVDPDTQITLTAVASDGYEFVGWYKGEQRLSEEVSYVFTVSDDMDVEAKFELIPPTTYRFLCKVQGDGKIWENNEDVTEKYMNGVSLAEGTNVTLTATAYGSYEFAGWYTPSGLLSESETYTFTMDGNKSIEAKFNDTGRVGVLFSATPEGSGYFAYNNVKSDGIAENWEIGTEYTVRAVPNPGYKFLYWEIENEKIRSEVYSGTVPSDGLYCLAVFDAADYYLEVSAVGGKIQEQYIDDTRVNDAEFVTEYKKGFYNVNSVTLTAEADEGYRFVGWYNEEGLLSDYASVSVSFSDEKQIKLEARFEKIEYRFSASASEGGYITENGEAVDFGNGRIVDPDTQITLTAVASDGYEFVGWYKGGQRLSEEVSYVFTVSDDMDVEAIFKLIPPTTYRFLCEIQGNGKIWENNEDVTSVYMYGVTLAEGTNVTLTATADTYWRFVGWYNAFADGELISADATYTFKLTEHISVYALFEEKITYNFLAQCSPSDGGYITENGETVDFGNGRSVDPETQITLTAVENSGYKFECWGIYDEIWNLTVLSTDATHTFTVTENTAVYAVFEELTFLAQCEPSEGGYITENGETVDFGNGRPVEMNEQITLTAVANTGYEFKGWGTRDDEWNLTIISTEATYTFTVTGKTYVQAVFAEKPNGLKIDAHNAGFTYNENDELTTTVYTIGSEIQPDIEHVGVYATFNTSQDEYLTLDEDYTRDLGGLDFTEAGTYTVTYTYKKDTSLTATLTVQVVEKSADGSLTEVEWNAAIAYWKAQTNVKVVERIPSRYDDDLGAQIMIYQFDGVAYSEDGGFENDPVDYKGKASYWTKEDDRYCYIYWGYLNEECWVKNPEIRQSEYEGMIESTIYRLPNYVDVENDNVFDYSNFTYDEASKTYKNSAGTISFAFTFEDNVLTKLVLTQYRESDGTTFVRTITFGDAVVDVPNVTVKYYFRTIIKTEGDNGVGGYLTENGEQVSYPDYLEEGATVTLTAVANEGYVFKGWATEQLNGEDYEWIIVSTEETFTVIVDKDSRYACAVFEKVEADS